MLWLEDLNMLRACRSCRGSLPILRGCEGEKRKQEVICSKRSRVTWTVRHACGEMERATEGEGEL